MALCSSKYLISTIYIVRILLDALVEGCLIYCLLEFLGKHLHIDLFRTIIALLILILLPLGVAILSSHGVIDVLVLILIFSLVSQAISGC